MVWPQTQLPLRVKIAPGANPAAAPSTWPSWVDITNSVRVADGIQISDGRANEAALVDASSMSLTLDDRVGDFNPINPNGAYYPLLKRNCPIRVGVDICSDNFNRTASGGWGTPSTVATTAPITWLPSNPASDFTVSGTQGQVGIATNSFRSCRVTGGEAADTEGRVTVSTPVVALGASISMGGIARYTASPLEFYFLEISFDVGGTCKCVIGKNFALTGSFSNLASFNLGAYSAGQLWTVAWQVVGATIAMKAWPTAGAEPAGWQVGFNDPAAINGVSNGVAFWRQNGNTNVGTSITLSADDYRLEDIEYAGNIVEFPVTWDQSGRDSVAQLKAAGPFRRLQQGQTPLKSPLGRQWSSAAASGPVYGLWMMEDDSGSLGASSQVSGIPALAIAGVSFGASADLPGSLQQARLDAAGSRISGTGPFRAASPNGGTAAVFLRAPSAVGGTGTDLVTFFTTGPVARWVVHFDTASMTLSGFDSSGTLVTGGGATAYPGGFNATQWFSIALQLPNATGTSLAYSLVLNVVGTNNPFFVMGSGTVATTSFPSVTGLVIATDANMAGTFVGPIRFGDTTFPYVNATFRNVAAGWFGESAGARLARLANESGVACNVEGGTTEPMGIQRVNSLFPLMRECEATDFGILYEAGWGVAYRPRASRYSRTPVLVLDRNSGHLADPPTPTLDDQRLLNDVSVSRDGGAQNVRYFDQTSVTNEGTYDTSLTINTSTDDVLPSHAAWRVYLGIQPELRWPDLSLDFQRNPSLIAAWRSRVFADRMTVASELLQVQGSPPNVIIEGTTVTLSAFQWTAECNCSPAKPWDVATIDDTNLRMDTVASTIAAAPSPAATGTNFTVATTSGPLWVTTAVNPAEFPFNIIVAGEVMTVTAIVGATSPQTFTVIRNINALVNGKSQVIGAAVALQRPMVLAL